MCGCAPIPSLARPSSAWMPSRSRSTSRPSPATTERYWAESGVKRNVPGPYGTNLLTSHLAVPAPCSLRQHVRDFHRRLVRPWPRTAIWDGAMSGGTHLELEERERLAALKAE